MSAIGLFILMAFVTHAEPKDTVNEELGEKLSKVLIQQSSMQSQFEVADVQNLTDGHIKINALIALTGKAAYLGHGIKIAIRKAVDDMCRFQNLDIPRCSTIIDIQYFDTQSSPDVALDFFKKAYHTNGVRVFIGLITSEEAKPVAEYASTHAQDSIILSPSSTATELCEYKQLYRLTMDDRGFVDILFDMYLEMVRIHEISNLPVYIIHRDDLHGNGLVRDVTEIFEKEINTKFDAAQFAFSYSDQNTATKALSELNNKTASTQFAMVLLAGPQEDVQFIMNELKKFEDLSKFPWVLSDMTALSNINIRSNMDLYGLNYRGSLDELGHKFKLQRKSLIDYLRNNEVPPMVQPLLAYDAVSLIFQSISIQNNDKLVFQFNKKQSTYEGVTGLIDFSSCQERASGEYSLSIKKHNDNLESAVITKKWVFLSHYKVNALESSTQEAAFQIMQNAFATSEELTPEAAIMAENKAKTIKVDITSTQSAAAVVYRRELIHALESVKSTKCLNNARIVISSKDDASNEPINTTYSLASFPETLAIPAGHGFILDGSCMTNTVKFQVVKVCPSASVAGSELTCAMKVSSYRINHMNEVVTEQLSTVAYIASGVCYVGTAACYVGSVFIAFVSAPACGTIGSGCGALANAGNSFRSGGKYVCTELFRQGYMSPELMLADMNFAVTYSKDHPIIRKGYDILGPFVASLMKDSETITQTARYFAIPWAEEMAYREGYSDESNEFGSWVMSVGSIVCGVVGGIYTYAEPIGITITAVIVSILIGAHAYKRLPKHID